MSISRTWLATLALGIAACGGGGAGSSGSSPPPAPTIAAQPESRVVPVGQTATFSVAAHGSGLTYAWVRDGVSIPGATSATYTTPPTSTVDDGATFAVVVSNAAGSVTSGDAKLRIEGFVPAGPLRAARQRHAAARLPDGRVLVCGGYAAGVLSSAELYDPATGTFDGAQSLIAARQDHTATVLASGKVLVVGGEGGVGGGVPLATAELFDPGTGLFAPAGPLHAARTLHTATLLANGKVLVAGGLDAHGTALATAEVYDPATNAFTVTAGDLSAARYWHAAALLADGKALVAGGYGTTGGALDGADVFDPATGRFSPTGPMKAARYGHSATPLQSGLVLVAGGYGGGYLATAELYDPAAASTLEAFAETGPMSVGRYSHTATALPGGKVLVAGGLGASVLSSAELYDPDLAQFAPSGVLSAARYLDTATLLLSGQVLVAGGWSLSDRGLSSADLYSGAP